MYRYALKIAAFLVGFFPIAVALTACGGNDDGPASIPGRLPGPTKISYEGITISKFTYDSEGRMTSMTTEDLKMTINYSPLTIKIVEDDDVMSFEKIELNSRGYIVKAYITDYINDEVDEYWATLTYDAAGHWTGIQIEDESSVITWSDTTIRFDEEDDDGYILMRMSDVKNTAGVFSPNWGGLGRYGMTGLFGKAPDYFLSSMEYIDPEYGDNEAMGFKYLLLTDGRIGKESLTQDDITLQLTYSYPTRSADDSFVGDDATVSTKKFKNIFKRKRK